MPLAGQFSVAPAPSASSSISKSSSQNSNPPKAIFLNLSDAALRHIQTQFNANPDGKVPGLEIELGHSSAPHSVTTGKGLKGVDIPLAINVGSSSYALTCEPSTSATASSASSSVTASTSIIQQHHRPRKSGSTSSSTSSFQTLYACLPSTSTIPYTAADEPVPRKPREKTAANMGERMRERKEQLAKEKEGKRIKVLEDEPAVAGKGAKRGRPPKSANGLNAAKAGASPLLRASALSAKARSPSPHTLTPRGSPVIGAAGASRPKTNRLVASDAAKGLMSKKEKESHQHPPHTMAQSSTQAGHTPRMDDTASTHAHQVSEKVRMPSNASSTSTASSNGTLLSATSSTGTSVSTAATSTASSATSAQPVRPAAPPPRRYHQQKADDSDIASSESSDDDEDKIPLAKRIPAPEKVQPAALRQSLPAKAASSAGSAGSDVQERKAEAPPKKSTAAPKGRTSGSSAKQALAPATSAQAQAPVEKTAAPSSTILIASTSSSSAPSRAASDRSSSSSPGPVTFIQVSSQKRKRSGSAAGQSTDAPPSHTRVKREGASGREGSHESRTDTKIETTEKQPASTASIEAVKRETSGGDTSAHAVASKMAGRSRPSDAALKAEKSSPGGLPQSVSPVLAERKPLVKKEEGEPLPILAKTEPSSPRTDSSHLLPERTGSLPGASAASKPISPTSSSALHPLPARPEKQNGAAQQDAKGGSALNSPAASPGHSPSLLPADSSSTSQLSLSTVAQSERARPSISRPPSTSGSSLVGSTLASKPLPPGLPAKPSTVIPPYGLKRMSSTSSLSRERGDENAARSFSGQHLQLNQQQSYQARSRNGSQPPSGANSPIISHFPKKAKEDGRSPRLQPVTAVSSSRRSQERTENGELDRKRKSLDRQDGEVSKSAPASAERKTKKKKKSFRTAEIHFTSSEEEGAEDAEGESDVEFSLDVSNANSGKKASGIVGGHGMTDAGEEGELPEEGEEVEKRRHSPERRGRSSEKKEVRGRSNAGEGGGTSGKGVNARLSSVGGLSFSRKGSRASELRASSQHANGNTSSRAATPGASGANTGNMSDSERTMSAGALDIVVVSDSDFIHYSRRFADELYPSYERLHRKLDKLRHSLDGPNASSKEKRERERSAEEMASSLSELRKLVDETNDRGRELEAIKRELTRYNDAKRRRAA